MEIGSKYPSSSSSSKSRKEMNETPKTSNPKLTMSYDHPVDDRFPLVTLTLPELYKLRVNCTLDTGVTWHTSAEKLTYKQLYTQGMRLAKGLLALGLCRGDNVLSVGVDGSESTLLFIAASSIGVRFAAPYIYPPLTNQIGYHIKNLNPKLIIVGDTLTGPNMENPYPEVLFCLNKLANEDPAFPLPALYREKGSVHTEPSGTLDLRLKNIDYIQELMNSGETIADESLEAKMSEMTPNEPCYYTMSSGSSGLPKTIVTGAAIFVNAGSRRAERWNLSPSTRVGSTSMCTEDYGLIEEIASGFYNGHEILVVPPMMSEDHEEVCQDMLEAIEKHRTQLVYADQYFLSYMVNNPKILEGFDISCVRGLIFSGTGMSPSFKQSLVNLFPDSMDWYGLSEYSCGTCTEIGSMVEDLLTVGKSSINQEIKVVDEDEHTVPVNTKGELWIRGNAVFLEYKDQPELTSEVKTGDGWYRTGDCATMDGDGKLRIIGRKSTSERYKVNNDVVYAQPIEKIMRTCPQIQDIVVVGRATGTPVGDEISYCVILHEKESMTVEEVYEFAISHVESSTEFPLRVFFYDEFPRHGSRSKISRKDLAKDVEEAVKKDFGINFADQSYLEQFRLTTNNLNQ